VLAQSFADYELIVIDDGSRDDTADVAEARSDSRVKVVRSENQGVSAARNRGLDLASGEYVAFLDADDAWQPPKLQRQRDAMAETPAAGMCFTATEIVDDDLRPIGGEAAEVRPDYTRALVLEGNIIAGGGSSVMARRSLVDQIGRFDTQLSQCADWDLWLRLSVVAELLPLADPLVLYRVAGGSMSSNPALLERDTIAMLDKFFASPGAAGYAQIRRRAYANQRMVCAGSYLHTRRLRDSLRCILRALRDDPRSAGRLASVPLRWADRARRRVLRCPPSQRDAISRRS
jgi:glycosyltransferase involved in cell wall biosynthesis